MYFYIFQNIKTNMIKLGITEDVQKRKAQLERQGGVALWEVAWTETHAAITFESFIMDLHNNYRQLGEWFEIPLEERGTLEKMYNQLAKWRDDYKQLVYYVIKNADEEPYVYHKFLSWFDDPNAEKDDDNTYIFKERQDEDLVLSKHMVNINNNSEAGS